MTKITQLGSVELRDDFRLPGPRAHDLLNSLSSEHQSEKYPQADLLEQSHQKEDISREYDLVPGFSSIRSEASLVEKTLQKVRRRKARGTKKECNSPLPWEPKNF